MKPYASNPLLADLFQSIGKVKETLQGLQQEMAFMEEILSTLSANTDGISMSAELEKKLFNHSPDFRSVYTGGRQYSFTTAQATCIKILYEQWKNKTPEISSEYILEIIGYCSQRLSDLFKKHPAWGQLIIPGNTRGTYRLNIS